jgi:transcriptional regulator with XRE-family HTH domain
MLGERLRAARMMAKLSQEQLAESAGVSKMAISKYERGKMLPSSGVLMRLAHALDRKVEYFLRPIQVQVQSPVHRGRARRSKRDEEAAQARVQEWIERYLNVEAVLNMPASFEMPPIEPSLDDIERVAVNLREEWGLGLGPIADLTKVLEDKGIRIGIMDVDMDREALLFKLGDGTPVMAVRGGVPGDRLRFSLAHELGHLILQVGGERDEEKLCNHFAGAFLVPEPTVRQELSNWGPDQPIWYLILLKQKYGLSIQGWIMRAKQVGIISQAECEGLFRMMSQNRWRKTEPGEQYPEEQPQRMNRLVKVALMAGIISQAKAAELLCVPMADITAQMEHAYGTSTAAVRS